MPADLVKTWHKGLADQKYLGQFVAGSDSTVPPSKNDAQIACLCHRLVSDMPAAVVS